MRVSQESIKKIKEFEGVRLRAYKAVPTEKYYTIGYGHYSKDINANTTITIEKADEYFNLDISKVERQVDGLNLSLNQNQFDAICDFIFNVGFCNFSTSTLLKKIKGNAPIEEIQKEFLRWNKSGGKVLQGLVRRREWESNLFAE